MTTIPLTTQVTATDLDDVISDRKVETLDECFRRLHKAHANGSFKCLVPFGADRFATHRLGFNQATAHGAQRPHEAMKIVEIAAAWVQASLDVIEAHWCAEMDRLLAAFNPKDSEASTIDYDEFCRATKSLEISCGLRRTNVTKAAYGITYAEFVA